MLSDFLRTKRTKEELKTALDVLREFKGHESPEEWHPDKGGSVEGMAKLNAAWECLGNAQRRLVYDRAGHDGSGPSVEEAGQGVLMEFFDRILNEGDDKNIVPRVFRLLHAQMDEIGKQKALMDHAHKALTNARSKVKKKKAGGLHIYHALIDKRLHILEVSLVEAVRKREEFQHALSLLDEYESELVTSPFFTATTTTATTGGFR